MRIDGRHFALSLVCAVLVNVLVVLVLIPLSEGVNSKAVGPQIDFDVTAGGLLGAAVEPTEVAEEVTTEDPLPEEKTADDAAESEMAETTEQARLEDAATPDVDAEAVIVEEPVAEEENPLTAEPESLPELKPVKAIKKPKSKTKDNPKKWKAKPKTTQKKGKAHKRAKSGSKNRGAGGAKKGGGGKARASRGAISSYKSRVQARMASCVRRRVSGRGAGRVTIRFGIGSGGGVRGVSVSGTGALRGVASSAARGCSMPPPPHGAGRLRFAFPVTVR